MRTLLHLFDDYLVKNLNDIHSFEWCQIELLNWIRTLRYQSSKRNSFWCIFSLCIIVEIIVISLFKMQVCSNSSSRESRTQSRAPPTDFLQSSRRVSAANVSYHCARFEADFGARKREKRRKKGENGLSWASRRRKPRWKTTRRNKGVESFD